MPPPISFNNVKHHPKRARSCAHHSEAKPAVSTACRTFSAEELLVPHTSFKQRELFSCIPLPWFPPSKACSEGCELGLVLGKRRWVWGLGQVEICQPNGWPCSRGVMRLHKSGEEVPIMSCLACSRGDQLEEACVSQVGLVASSFRFDWTAYHVASRHRQWPATLER